MFTRSYKEVWPLDGDFWSPVADCIYRYCLKRSICNRHFLTVHLTCNTNSICSHKGSGSKWGQMRYRRTRGSGLFGRNVNKIMFPCHTMCPWCRIQHIYEFGLLSERTKQWEVTTTFRLNIYFVLIPQSMWTITNCDVGVFHKICFPIYWTPWFSTSGVCYCSAR